MARRLIVLVVLGLAVPATALAATVKVRIEGKTRTLFAPTEVTVTAQNALDALEQASVLGELYYHVTVTGFGPYVDQVGRYGGSASSGWVFKVNDASPPVGADKLTLHDGDRVLWYYADFGPTGGPPTLRIKRSGVCYTATAFDDNGKAVAVNDVTWHVGSKRAVMASSTARRFCPGHHEGLLIRAEGGGAIRSNALP